MLTTQPITVFIADDHPIVRDGIRFILGSQPDIVIVGEAESGLDLLNSVIQSNPQVLILDLNMPNFPKPTDFVQEIGEASDTAVLVLTAIEDTEVSASLIEAGATGYLLKDTLTISLPQAIRHVANGGLWIAPKVARALKDQPKQQPLTSREQEIVSLILDGISNREISERLSLSFATVRTHLRNIFAKKGVHSRSQLQALARKRGS